jgi:hypothetical protein
MTSPTFDLFSNFSTPYSADYESYDEGFDVQNYLEEMCGLLYYEAPPKPNVMAWKPTPFGKGYRSYFQGVGNGAATATPRSNADVDCVNPDGLRDDVFFTSKRDYGIQKCMNVFLEASRKVLNKENASNDEIRLEMLNASLDVWVSIALKMNKTVAELKRLVQLTPIKSSWTPLKLRKLSQAACADTDVQDWLDVSQQVGKTPIECYRKWIMMGDEEKEEVLFKSHDWVPSGSVAPLGEDPTQDDTKVQGWAKWSKEESALLLKLVEQTGRGKWKEIASQIPTRTREQCREHYEKYINPEINRSKFTPEEDARLVQIVKETKPKGRPSRKGRLRFTWKGVAEALGTSRTGSMIAARYAVLNPRYQLKRELY